MSKKVNYEIEIPFFCGYYESRLYNGEMENDILIGDLEGLREQFNDDTLNYDDLEFDFKSYVNETNECFVEEFERQMNWAMPGLIKDICFSEMESPKYYNYETDRLFAKCVLCDDWQGRILEFMEDNKDWLREQIKSDWSDKSGFMSFMDNTYDGWVEEMSKDEPDWLYLSVMFGYILMQYDEDIKDTLIERTLESVYPSCYVINLKGREKR